MAVSYQQSERKPYNHITTITIHGKTLEVRFWCEDTTNPYQYITIYVLPEHYPYPTALPKHCEQQSPASPYSHSNTSHNMSKTAAKSPGTQRNDEKGCT
jgi:hypothetical protein